MWATQNAPGGTPPPKPPINIGSGLMPPKPNQLLSTVLKDDNRIVTSIQDKITEMQQNQHCFITHGVTTELKNFLTKRELLQQSCSTVSTCLKNSDLASLTFLIIENETVIEIISYSIPFLGLIGTGLRVKKVLICTTAFVGPYFAPVRDKFIEEAYGTTEFTPESMGDYWMQKKKNLLDGLKWVNLQNPLYFQTCLLKTTDHKNTENGLNLSALKNRLKKQPNYYSIAGSRTNYKTNQPVFDGDSVFVEA
jgi:hypothetical protein